MRGIRNCFNIFSLFYVCYRVSGAQLAMIEINRLELIPGAYVTLIEKDSYPIMSQMEQAIFSTISLIQQEGAVGIIGDISSLSAIITSNLQIPHCSYTSCKLIALGAYF